MEQKNASNFSRRGVLGLVAGAIASVAIPALPGRANAATAHKPFAKKLRHHTQEELASALLRCSGREWLCTPLRVTAAEFLGVVNREFTAVGATPLTVLELAEAIRVAKPMPHSAFAEEWQWYGVDPDRTFPLEPARKGRDGEMVILIRGVVPISLQCLNPGKIRSRRPVSTGWPVTTRKPRVPRIPQGQQ